MFVRKSLCNSCLQSITILLLCALSNQSENRHNNASSIYKSYIQSTQMRDKIRLNDTSFYNNKNVEKLELNAKLNTSKQTNDYFNNFDGIHHKSSLFANSSNSTAFDALALVLNLLSNVNSSENQSNITSESRTISSWLGLKRFRRPYKERLQTRPIWHTLPSHPHRIHQVVDHSILNFLPRPEGFPGPNDANAILLPPNVFEDSGLKYWLQFIENGGNPEKVQLDFAHKPHNIERIRKPINSPMVYSKPIEIGDKPTDNEELFNEEEEYSDENDYDNKNDNNDKNNEENLSDAQSGSLPQESQKFDTSPRCDKFTTDICIDDFEYPEQAIVDEIYKRKEVFELMYSEVKDNVPLVDGIPRDVEESYNYDYYYNNDNRDPQASGTEYGKKDKGSPSGFVCPSEVLYGKPKLARNKMGDWKVIVNAAEFTQTVRMEKCLKPNSKCNYISYPDYNSRCAQVHSFHRLMVFEKGRGFYIDTFRIPTACTCHVNRRTINYKPIQTSSENSEIHQNSKAPALSNTLWSILGGSPKNIANIANSQELIQNQINLLNHIKHLPQSIQISPENVIKQLMDLQSSALAMPQQNLNHFNSQNTSPMLFNAQSVPTSGQNHFDYFLPNAVMNEDFQDNSQMQEQRPGGSISVHHSPLQPGTTTYVNPNGNGAPVVQVIHVPVTSGIPSNSQPLQPVFNNNRTPAYSGYSYLDANSLFARNQPPMHHNSADIYSSIEDNLSEENFKPLLLEMSTKSNSSLLPPDAKFREQNEKESAFSQRHNSPTKEETTDKRKGIASSNTLNRKINFSYHPIFEYISN